MAYVKAMEDSLSPEVELIKLDAHINDRCFR